MKANEKKELMEMINFAIHHIQIQILAGSSFKELTASNKGLIFDERCDLYCPRKHPVDVYLTVDGEIFTVCKWTHYGDVWNDKQRSDIVKEIGAWYIDPVSMTR